MKIKESLHSVSPKMAIFPQNFRYFNSMCLRYYHNLQIMLIEILVTITELKKSNNIEEGVSCKYKIMVTFATCKF